ncbi:hypothetical protein DAMA08_034600 [Martiniozyma asiatica (nom. inval.)]|nr:hypothetical protein DAMA08_034600 [Martiniozyma asiatica]
MSRFAPKKPAIVDEPLDTPIKLSELVKCTGEPDAPLNSKGLPCMFIAIKGTVFDVSGNTKAYGSGAGYHPLVGKDSSRPLGKSSLNPEDTDPKVSWDWSSLDDREQKVMNDWYTFFQNRYSIVGKISDLPRNIN